MSGFSTPGINVDDSRIETAREDDNEGGIDEEFIDDDQLEEYREMINDLGTFPVSC